MKLFTTSTALARFGPDAPDRDQGARRRRRSTASGVLHGSLYLQGGGDPALGTPAFYDRFLGGLGTEPLRAEARRSARRASSAVTGRLYADDTDLRPPPRGRRLRLRDQPLHRPALRPLLQLRLQQPERGAASPPTRPRLAAAKLARSLRAAGVRVPAQRRPAARPRRAPSRSRWSARRPISQLADATNVPSNNFFAEMLIKLLGARFGGGGSTAAGAAVVAALRPRPRLRRPRRRRLRPDPHQPRLARPGRARCCRRCGRAEAGDDFIQSLALAGREGTVADRMRRHRRRRAAAGPRPAP